MTQEKTLGRGLGSLIPKKSFSKEISQPSKTISTTSARPVLSKISMPADVSDKIIQMPVAEIKPNPLQPRKRFNFEELEDLVNSIKEYGIIQPLIVTATKGGYELVAGERRLRAAQKLGLKTVPVLIRETKDLEKLELSLIENIQRQDLNPIERAEAYQKLVKEFGLTQEQAAKRLAKPRSVVTNTLRLLELPADIQRAVAEGRINEGHAKVLLGLQTSTQQQTLFRKILYEKLTVRGIETEVKKIQVKKYERGSGIDVNLKARQEAMARALGTKVKIKKTGLLGGQIVIDFYSEEELDEIVKKIIG